MKNLFLFLSLLFCLNCFSQVDTTKTIMKVNAHGYAYKNLEADSSFQLPQDTFRLKSTWRGLAFKNNVPYFWNGSTWNSFGSTLSITSIGSSPNANGMTLSSGILNLEPASASFGGVVTTGTQTFAGAKTFSRDLTVNSITFGRGNNDTIRNTAAGYQTLSANTTGTDNTGVGYQSLKAITSGIGATALGSEALKGNTTGNFNTAIGAGALKTLTTASANTAVGNSALYANTGGTNNVAVGVNALTTNTTASNSVAVGTNALFSNTTGAQNIGIGSNALLVNTTGEKNSVVGDGGMEANTTGSRNSSLGVDALLGNTTGSNHSAVGWNALSGVTTGDNNTAIGYQAGASVTTGSGNFFAGYQSGYNGSQKVDAVKSFAIGPYTHTDADSSGMIGASFNKKVTINGEIYAPTLSTSSSLTKLVGYYSSTGLMGYLAVGSGLALAGGTLSVSPSGVTMPINNLLAATGALGINNGNYELNLQWNTLASGSGLKLTSTSTDATANGQTILDVQASGTNTNSNQITYGASISNIHQGTGSTNRALRLSATSGSTNQALYVENGNVVLNPLTASLPLKLDASKNITSAAINLSGSEVTSTLAATNGGTGASTVSTGDLLYGSASNVWSKLSAGATAGMFLRNGGASTAPSWSTLVLPNSATANYIPITTSSNTWGEDQDFTYNQSTGVFSTGNGTNSFSFTPASTLASISGPSASTSAFPNLQFKFNGDANPTISYLNYNHDNMRIMFDAWYSDGAGGYVSSHSGSNFNILKNGNKLSIGTNSGTAAGSGFSWSDEKWYIDVSGNVVNTGTLLVNGTVRFSAYGAGTATFDASGNISSVSDVRLKTVQGNYSAGLSAIKNIRPIVYKWNSMSGMEMDHSYIGFSAQNIQQALGDGATGINKDGYLSIQDRAIMATLVNAIQEQQKQIEELTKEVKRLKKR